MTIKRYSIIEEIPPLPEDAESIFKQLSENNKQLLPAYKDARLWGFFIKENGKVLGGAVGHLWLGAIRVVRLFVQKHIRKQGYGKELLKTIEDYGCKHGANFIALETLSFQNSLEFYLKNGFHIVYEEKNYSNDIIMYHLRKKLPNNKKLLS
ncbi:MAG: hypothetical protein BGO77_08440 [Caedibacter sp. 37-49]|nr:MAG: hypothetical protein BGO77_08440 [Caedibacter sp. 37-49]